MKKILLFVVIALMLVQTVFAGSIVRTFSDVTINGGDTISVTYTADGTAPFVKEIIPGGWAVVNAGGGTVKLEGDIAVLRLQVGGSTTIKLKAPQLEQDYVFDGEYIIDGATAWIPFSPTTVKVGAGDGGCTPNEVCGEWSECVNDKKERTCYDGCEAQHRETESCGVPGTTDICEYMTWAESISPENYCGVGIGIIIGGIFVLVLLLRK